MERFGSSSFYESSGSVGCLFTELLAPVAQTWSLSVSVQIVAGRANLSSSSSSSFSSSEMGRSRTRTRRRTMTIGLRLRRALSVSPEIVAAREDFFNHGWTRINTDEDRLSLIRVHPCSSVVGTYWLRLCRAALYRRFSTCQMSPARNVLPITNRRYGRLKICATLNGYSPSGRGRTGRHLAAIPAKEFANPVCAKHWPGGGCSLSPRERGRVRDDGSTATECRTGLRAPSRPNL